MVFFSLLIWEKKYLEHQVLENQQKQADFNSVHCLVEELELRLQQEQTGSHDLRSSLEAEKSRGLEQQGQLEVELKAVSVLKGELEETRLELQTTYKNQDELKSQIHKLRYSKHACTPFKYTLSLVVWLFVFWKMFVCLSGWSWKMLRLNIGPVYRHLRKSRLEYRNCRRTFNSSDSSTNRQLSKTTKHKRWTTFVMY